VAGGPEMAEWPAPGRTTLHASWSNAAAKQAAAPRLSARFRHPNKPGTNIQPEAE